MNTLPVNEQIRAHAVILIGPDGTKRGQFLRAAALTQARTEGLDLIQVSENNPPVCKIGDFGKLQYERRKSERNHSKQPEQKEMWCHIDTQKHDLDIKLKKVSEWLSKGHKVRMVVKLEGRERYSDIHRQMARDLLLKYVEDNKSVCASGPLSSGLKDVSVLYLPTN